MDKEEAKRIISNIDRAWRNFSQKEYVALEMAIKALSSSEKMNKWIPVSEDLPKDFGTYLITLENGDVCKCGFNPDFIDEEHENGAFTYYQEYFDPATLGLIDGEEEAVNAIAWMPFEPYEPQEGREKE